MKKKPDKPNFRSKAAKTYTSTHWGIEPEKATDHDDDDLPDELTVMGEHLIELVISRGEEDMVIEFPVGSILAFDPDKSKRLYAVLTASTCRMVAANLLGHEVEWFGLEEVAEAAGGRQAAFPTPSLPVQVLGYGLSITYKTEKEGDGLSLYEHEFGEVSGVRPILCCDEYGRIWFAGGNYTVTDHGVED